MLDPDEYKYYFPYKSSRPTKKFMVLINDDGKIKWIHFGDITYQHYTEGHLDEKRRHLYEMRHMKRENWNNPNTAAYWSFWYLWRFRTYKEAMKFIKKDLKQKMNLNLKNI